MVRSAYGRQTPPPEYELTWVEPGSPMGELLRRYWQPVCKSDELRDLPEEGKAALRGAWYSVTRRDASLPLSRIAHTEGTPDQIAEGFDYYNSLRSSGADNSSVASTSALAKMTRKPDEWASGITRRKQCRMRRPQAIHGRRPVGC
jgi:hypothetical protein